ncbi:helix-turn-helix domain-containing protein [Staphylococcus xylosus]|uniref:helix-turn-helix domain-containing protein n=1 Tax=Staphylococcus xylosus TaxID=1288 RepID=UPI0036CC2F8D
MNEFEIKQLMKYISYEFKHIRKARRLILEDVAFEIGVTPSYIGNIENGNREKLSLYMYLVLADYYNIPIEEIIINAKSRKEIDDQLK